MVARRSSMRAIPALAALLALVLDLSGCLAPVEAIVPATAVARVPTASRPMSPSPFEAPSKAPSPGPSRALSPAGDRLYVVDQVATQGGWQTRLQILDTASGAVARDFPLGYPSPDWSTLYSLQQMDNTTTLRAFDLASGRLLRQTSLDGLYTMPVSTVSQPQLAFSPDGRWLALSGNPSAGEEKTWQQTGHPRSRFLIVDTALARQARAVDLLGNFWFDALSSDGNTLYLVEVLDAYPPSYSLGQPPRYQVRSYDLVRGELAAQPVVDKTDVEDMSGFHQAGVFSSDQQWLYSLYTRAGQGPFIHALNLAAGYAVCIDLPFQPSGNGEQDLLWSLTLAPDGSRLYAANGGSGQLAVLDTATLQVLRSVTLPGASAAVPDALARFGRWLMPVAEAKREVNGAATLSPDGKTLYVLGQKGVLVVDTAGLSLRRRLAPDRTLNSLAISPDGARLYAVDGTRPDLPIVTAIDAGSGAILGQFPVADQPAAVLRVDAGR